MKKVYLIRHGLPDFPEGKRMCLGVTDIPLGKEGYAQAAEMAKKLPPVTAVFSSPLSRTIQTAQAIGMPVVILEGLRELYAGDWDGLDFDQIHLRYPQLYAARGIDPTLPLPNCEPDEAGLSRFREAMKEAAAAAEGDFAVVAHGGVIRLFLKSLGRISKKPEYAQIIPLVYENGTFYLQEEAL